MTFYQALKSLTEEQATAFFCGGLLNSSHVRNIKLFEYYEDKIKSEPKMLARTETAERFYLSEDRVSAIIQQMRKEGRR